MHKYFSLVVICLTLYLSACSSSSQPQTTSTSPTPKPEPTRNPKLKLADAEIQEIIPTADGGAYIWTFDNHLWYVRGGIAVRVHEADDIKISTNKIPNANNGFFALWIRERQKLKKIREEKDSLENEIGELEDKLNDLEAEEGGDKGDQDN